VYDLNLEPTNIPVTAVTAINNEEKILLQYTRLQLTMHQTSRLYCVNKLELSEAISDLRTNGLLDYEAKVRVRLRIQ